MKMRDVGGADDLPFDGIICIGGEDWWYHNRGHFDFQIMRRLAKDWPVLFVNSLAVRMPSLKEKSQFAARIGRKLKSLSRGCVNVENKFWVFSPVSVPGPTGQKLSNWALAPQIKLAAARAGIKRPLLWVHCPAGTALVNDIPHAALVLQRTDRFESFPEADPAVVGAQIKALKAAADLVVYCNANLMAEEASEVRRQLLITHGVDLEMFIAAGKSKAPGPADVAVLKRPRVGFVGGIDAHTFGPKLFLGAASRLPDVEFALIGGCSLPEGWCTLPNVKLLGRKPYEQVASYMAAMDVLIMPWNDSDWIQACNPIKLKEYLAAGRPVVTTDFPALGKYRDIVRVAKGSRAFAEAIRSALSAPYDAERARKLVATEGWDAKASYLGEALVDLIYEMAEAREGAGRKARTAA
jgi:glycosyltransferase involved in cell wall biosynthesis